MKRTDFQKLVVNTLQSSTNIGSDRTVCKEDGSVVVRRSFFYRHGNSAESFADRVREALTGAGVVAVVRGSESWNSWPHTSWFIATIKEQV